MELVKRTTMHNLLLLFHLLSLQMACQSGSDALANRKRFRSYFQILETANVAAYGFFAIIHEFGWRRVIILEQNESLFTRVSDETMQLLPAGLAQCKFSNLSVYPSPSITAYCEYRTSSKNSAPLFIRHPSAERGHITSILVEVNHDLTHKRPKF